MNALADRMKQLVAKGKVHVALKQLQNIDAFDDQLQTQIETLSSRYHQLQNQIINGIVCRNEINLENNRIANSLLLLINRFPDGNTLLKYKLNKLAKNLEISVNQVQTIIKALEERYQSRLYQKMNNYLSLSLQLSYTQEGTDQKFVETFFDEESKGTDFIQKNCLEVLKQHRHLLILGDPGAGKTTLLLQLAINLLKQYEELQIPIIFNLASWTKKDASFKEWLQNVLVHGYGFSKEFAAKSLAQNTILPLLDGFDEVGKAYKEEAIQNELRQYCLEAIGQYMTDENVQQFIICSRRKEYQAAPQNAPIRAEILINPLSIQQIENALAQQKSNELTNKERTLIEKLRLLKEQNHPLLEVIYSPFYFNLIFDTKELTDSLKDINRLPQKKAEIRQYLLNIFIKNKIMSIDHYSINKTTQYLSWLSYWMNRRDSVSFELADLQPAILKGRWLFGLVFGLVYSIVFCSIYILVSSLAYILIDGLIFDLGQNIINCLINGFVIGLVVGLVANFNKNLNIRTEDMRQTDWAKLMSLVSMVKVIKNTLKRAIQTAIILGLPLGFILGLGVGFVHDSAERFVAVLIGTLFLSFILGIIMGLVENSYQATTTVSFFKTIKTPYGRIKSGWLSYFFQAFFVLVIILLAFNSFEAIQGDNKLLVGFILLFIFPIILLLLIRMPLAQHCVLRIALTIEKKAPLQYVKFLNAATKARILEKDGGHWRFRHQLLQDYFAQLYQKD